MWTYDCDDRMGAVFQSLQGLNKMPAAEYQDNNGFG